VISDSDVLVVGLNERRVFDALKRHVRKDQIVLDLVNVPERETLPAAVEGLCW
jgi:hypothetical protein